MQSKLLLPLLLLAAAPVVLGLEKKSVPDAASQKEEEETLHTLYKDKYASTKPSDLAKYFMQLAADPKEEFKAKYVLWREASRLAAQCADTETAQAAIEALAAKFAVDVTALKKDALSAAVKAAQEAQNPEWARAISAMKTLLEAPNDGAANLALGEYYCLLRGEWAKGLPYLAKCSNETLKAHANEELGKPSAGLTQMALGEAWVDLADTETDPQRKQNLRQHGSFWLAQARTKLTGFSQKKVDWYLETIKNTTSTPAAVKNLEPEVEAGLRWLSAHQENDGHWAAVLNESGLKTDTACTGLALLAFVRAGNSEGFGAYKENVRSAVAWLRKHQRDDGLLFDTSDEGGQYGVGYPHGISGLALVAAAAVSKNPDTLAAAQKAVNYSVQQQQDPEGGGFRYSAKSPGSLSVTCWYIQQLVAAKAAGLNVDKAAWDGILKFIDNVTIKDAEAKTVVYYYVKPDVNKPDVVGSSPQLTMMGSSARLLLGAKPEEIAPSVEWALNHLLPTWGANGEKADLYYWYYGSLAAAKLAAAPDYAELAKRWNKALKAALTLHQQPKGPHAGSWDPVGEYSHDWGRAGQTALACLCLLRADN